MRLCPLLAVAAIIACDRPGKPKDQPGATSAGSSAPTKASLPEGASRGSAAPSAHASGFEDAPELREIERLTEQGDKEGARAAATALIASPSGSFEPPTREPFLKGSALFLRSFVAASEADTLADLEQAAAFGHPEAPYHLASHLLIASTSRRDGERQLLRPKIESLFLAGAQLADERCMDVLEDIYKRSGQRDDQNYWGMLRRMSEADEQRRKLLDTAFRETFTAEDRASIDHAMRAKSLSGGAVPPSQGGLPGRSTLTSLFVDVWMRKQLAFVWRAFFNANTPDATVTEVFDHYRQTVRAEPFGQLFLVLPSHASSDGQLSLTHEQLAAAILPGDVMIVLADGRSHYATVWAIDRPGGTILVLDPFWEFWQPTHNSMITRMEHVDYAPRRQLFRLSWPEVRNMLVAAIVVRDAVASR
ncbi:MAG TPA: hypothetical protein VF516_18265 [Kofleriaceae bacterium]